MLATVGSLGDLHPFIALGLALHSCGVQVVVACAAEYQAKVAGAGLACRAVRPSFEDLERSVGMDRAALTRAVLADHEFLLRRLILPGIRESFDDMRGIALGADLVLTSSLAFGARLAAESLSIPWLAIVLQPMLFLSAFDPPVIPGAPWLTWVLRRMGPAATALAFKLAKRAWRPLFEPLQALRAAQGLAPERDPLIAGQFSANGAIGLYSSLLGGIRADYPHPTHIVGFAWFDAAESGVSRLEPALEQFLAAGPAPLVFTLGSLIVNSPGSFYRESLGAAQRLGCRAVLLVGEQGVADLRALAGPDLHICAYAPHSLLFPRARAIVHQCGIGTTAQALRAGRPQLAVPFFADQADNAARAVTLGVARTLLPRRYDAAAAARELGVLLRSAGYSASAVRVRDVLAREAGAARAARVVLDRLESPSP